MDDDKLESLSDWDLNEVFAREVANWRIVCHCGDYADMHHMGSGHSPVEMTDECGPRPYFVRESEAVMPWLETRGWWSSTYSASSHMPPNDRYWVTVGIGHVSEGYAPTFARAACVALIRAVRSDKVTPELTP